MMMKRRLRDRNKTEEMQAKHNAVAHLLLANAQPSPEQESVAFEQLLQFITWARLLWCGKYFGWFVLATLPPGSLCIFSLQSMRH